MQDKSRDLGEKMELQFKEALTSCLSMEEFYINHKLEYPLLSQVASILLTLAPSSVNCERTFSLIS